MDGKVCLILDAFGQASMLFGHLFVTPLLLDEVSSNSKFLYTRFNDTDLSKCIMGELVSGDKPGQ